MMTLCTLNEPLTWEAHFPRTWAIYQRQLGKPASHIPEGIQKGHHPLRGCPKNRKLSVMTATAETADLMAQLQAAWRSTARPEPAMATTAPATVSIPTISPAKLPSTATEPKRPGSSTGRTSSSSVALAPASCGAHLDPSQWHREPIADRPGWLLATCRHCGKFIGYGPVAKARSKLTG